MKQNGISQSVKDNLIYIAKDPVNPVNTARAVLKMVKSPVSLVKEYAKAIMPKTTAELETQIEAQKKSNQPMRFDVGAGMSNVEKVLPGPRLSTLEAIQQGAQIEPVQAGEAPQVSPVRQAQQVVRKPDLSPQKPSAIDKLLSGIKLSYDTNPFMPSRSNPLQSNFEVALEPAEKKIFEKTLNTDLGKKVITKISESTEDIPLKLLSGIEAAGTSKTYGEVYSGWKKAKENPDNPLWKKFIYNFQSSAPQSLLGVAMSFVPYAGKPLAYAYWSALSAGEQIKDKGEVTSAQNIAIDTIGDSLLSGALEGLFKKPAKTLISTLEKSFLTEGGTESAQTLLKYANDYRTAKNETDRNQAISNAKQYITSGDILMEFSIGGLSGASIGGLGFAANKTIGQQPGLSMPDKPTEPTKTTKTPAEANKYLYHGTNEAVLDNISKEGLKPGMRGQLSLSKTDKYAMTFAREGMTPSGKTNSVMLRVKSDFLDGKTTLKRVDGKERPMPDQLNELLTKETIPPEYLEIYKDGKWQPLTTKVSPEVKPALKSAKLDTLNPTGSVFADYTPAKRATAELADNITTLDKTMKKPADEMITIYRGTGKGGDIVAGDFVTTNKQLAKDYAGTGRVIEKKVKLSDILDDLDEPLGEEYIYRPQARLKPSVVEPLIEEAKAQEARKYGSAEEFVSAQRKAFHGSPIKDLKKIDFGEGIRSNTFLGKTTKVKSGAIFFTPDENVAKFFAENRTEFLKDLGKVGDPTVYERYLNIKNPIDLTGKNIKQASQLLDKAKIDLEKEILGIEGFGRDLETLLEDKEIELSDLWKIVDKKENVAKLQKIGIDGAIFKETEKRGISYAIFNPNQAFTKQQLIDIYNQAVKETKRNKNQKLNQKLKVKLI